jgi:hypothetical protein
MLIYILSAIAIAILLLVVFVAARPAELHVVRSAKIAAPPKIVFPHVNDFHAWQAWSPWARLDPDAENSYEGPTSGTGAAFRWSGNKKVGAGGMTITDSVAERRIQIQLEFLKPMRATNSVEFTFEPDGDGTIVTWNMFGRNNFMAKAFGLLMNMDKMIGGDFEKGLASLKSIAEGEAK